MSESLSERKSLNRRRHGSIATLGGNAFDELIFSDKSRVAASTWANYLILIDEMFQRYLSDSCYFSKRAGGLIGFRAFRIVIGSTAKVEPGGKMLSVIGKSVNPKNLSRVENCGKMFN